MLSEQIKHLLSRYIDHQLDESERQKVEELLKSNPKAAEYYRQLQKLDQMAENFELKAGDKYWSDQKDAVLNKINEAEAERVTPLPVKRNFFSQYKWLAVAASIAMVAVISIFEIKYDKPENLPFAEKPATSVALSAKKDQIETLMPDKKTEDKLTITNEKEKSRDKPDEKIESRPKISVPTPVSPAKKKAAVYDRAKKGGRMDDEAYDDTEPNQVGIIKANGEKRTVQIRTLATPGLETIGMVSEPSPAMEPEVAMPTGENELSQKKSKPIKLFAPSIEAIEETDLVLSGEATTATEQSLDKTIRVTADRDQIDKFESSYGVTMTKEMPNEMLKFGADSPETEEYDLWLARFDSLDNEYNWWESDHRVMAFAKSRQAGTPLDSPTPTAETVEKMAEICHRVGLLTLYQEEKSVMLRRLEQLKAKADSGTINKIDQYISEIDSLLK